MTRRSGFAAAAAGIIVTFVVTPAFVQEDGLVLYGPLKEIPGVGAIARPSSSIHSDGVFHTHLQTDPDTGEADDGSATAGSRGSAGD